MGRIYQPLTLTRISLKSWGVAALGILFTLAISIGLLSSAHALQAVAYTTVPFTPTEVATNWATDRTTPSGGYGSVTYAGRSNILQMSIDTTKASSIGFYRTEGLQRQIPASDSIKADLYVDNAWQNTPVRAGLWGVAKDTSGNISAYPIIEYTTAGDGNFTGWRVWDGVNGGWTNLPNVAYKAGDWNTLAITLNKSTQKFDVSVNGQVVTSSAADVSANLSAVILNSYNYGTTVTNAADYTVHWSNFAYGNVLPNPTTKDQCKDNGWTTYGFSNQGQCVSYVTTGHDSRE